MILYLLSFIFIVLFPGVKPLSSPSVNPSNPNFQTGQTTLVSGSLNTTIQAFNFIYGNVMLNNSLKAAVGVLTQSMTLDGKIFGYELNVMSFDNTRMIIEGHANSDTNPITLMKICYMITGYVQLHVDRTTYAFNSVTDSVLNPLVPDFTSCPPSIQCRSTVISLPYLGIGNTKKAVAMISGFIVNDFKNGMGTTPVFGVGLHSLSAGTNALGLTVYVFGRALLTSVSIHYVSYQYESLNILGDKIILDGRLTVGCEYTWSGCNNTIDPITINTTFTTQNTGFSVYYSTNYLFGISSFSVTYTGTTASALKFTVTGSNVIGSTAYQNSFTYTGNVDNKFFVYYSYLIILQFYCPSTGSDIYYTIGSNMCNNTCNNTIGQYWDGSRKCQPCGVYCYTCSGASYLCDQCYASQNRILSGDDCICNPVGFYDDGSSVTCPSCHYSCRTCTGPSASQCIDCSTTSFRTVSINSCFCNARYYDNGVSICPSCHYTCLTCTANANTNCVTCAATDFRQILSSNNSCPCMIGYYNSGTNPVCALCHYSCWTCWGSGSSACSTCNTTVEFRVATPVSGKCNCLTGWYDSGTEICPACHVTCLSCNGGLKVDCLTCDGLKYRGGPQSGECKCKSQYYQVNVTCYACHYSCYNCTGGSKYQCINCNDAVTFRKWNGTSGQCYCINGYTDVGVDNCQMCDRTCLTCQNSSTTCKTCDAAKNRILTGSSCPCISGYIQTGLASGFCPKCHYSCLTCSGTASTQCVLCDTTYRTISSGKCLCPTHMYDDGINVLCQFCHAQCKQCTAQYDTTCTQCQATYLRQIVGVAPQPCTCIVRYFQNNNALVCDACHVSCLTCSVISTNCTSCDLTTDHRYLATGSRCLCQAHYYDVNSQACLQCVVTCGNCTNLPDNCTSCPIDRYLSANKCLCNLGTYQDAFLVCQTCIYYCKTCQNSTSTCLTCPTFSYRTLNSNKCPCDFGYYDNNVAVCAKCPYSCDGCTGPSPPQCIACPLNSQRTLQPDKSCTCNLGYYDDGSNALCKICKSTCLTCTSFSVCTSCFPLASQFRSILNNQCKCTTGYYDNFVNPICQLCYYSCATCSGGTSTNCMTCKPNRTFQPSSYSCPCTNGFYQASQVCYACDSTCKTCSNIATNCTSCDVTSRYLFNNQCLCREGFFQNGGVCSTCDVTCRTCITSSTNCQTCNVSHFTTLSGSTCVCLAGQYQNPITLVCTTCNIKCQTCIAAGDTSCLTCFPFSHRTYNPVSFTCDCDPGYYDDGNATCPPCNSTCMTCYGPSDFNCSSCYPGANKLGSTCRIPITCATGFLYEGFCLVTCPNTTYSSINVCQTCINNCKTCTSSVICTSCVNGFYFNSTALTCTINCPQGAFINHLTKQCENCPAGCQFCAQRNGTVVCPKCFPGFYLFNHSTCVDTVFCVIPFYVIVSTSCYACEYPCRTCNNLSFDGCVSCVTGFSWYGGQCLSICPAGYYALNGTCVSCQTRCSQCSATRCQVCKVGYYLEAKEQNPKCVTINFFYNLMSLQQQKCHLNCYSCTNSSFSSCITCQKFRGDQSQMAKSGYCDCWSDSIDLGDGNCSFSEYENIQTYTKVLQSTSDSTTYMTAVSSVFSANFMSAGVLLIYQQTYSMLYFVNSSAVLQTGQFLQESLNKNLNFYLNSRKSSNQTKSKPKYSRMLVSLQSDQSLFSRGNYYEVYLFDWAFYTVVITASLWFVILLSNCLLKSKRVIDNQICKTLFSNIKTVLQQSAIIILHLVTISQISLYATVTFKFIFQKTQQIEINWLKLILSIALAVYYIGYIFRLFVGCCTIGTDPLKKYAFNPLKLLVFYFDQTQTKQQQTIAPQVQKSLSQTKKSKFASLSIMNKLYIPFLMVRLMLSSVLIILFGLSPTTQVGSSLAIMIVWTIYSLLCCPYPKFCKIFIHLNQFVYLSQIGIMLYSVLSPQESRILPAYVQLALNGVQIGIMALFAILFIAKLICGICQDNKTSNSNNKVQNLYFNKHNENNQSELYLNQNKRDEQNEGFEIQQNVFDKQLDIQDFGEDEEKNKEDLTTYFQSKVPQVNVHTNRIINKSIQKKRIPSKDTLLNNQTKIISDKGENQEQNVIIRKKYRAVRKPKK